jgi:hypothetical protein
MLVDPQYIRPVAPPFPRPHVQIDLPRRLGFLEGFFKKFRTGPVRR